MELTFVKVSPSGNTTILVLDPLPRGVHGAVARHLMGPERLCADQVGFLERPASAGAAVRLQMMGGEFCANAVRAAAAYLVERGHPSVQAVREAGEGANAPAAPTEEARPGRPVETAFSGGRRVVVEASGTDRPIENLVFAGGRPGVYLVQAHVPGPLRIAAVKLRVAEREAPVEGTLVELSGITHVVLPGVEASQESFEAVRRQVGLVGGAAFGVMFYDPAARFMRPLVYVKESDSLVWEQSCGSGCIAVAAALSAARGEGVAGLRIEQPGGSITADVDCSGGSASRTARIQGSVELVAAGTVRCPGIHQPVGTGADKESGAGSR